MAGFLAMFRPDEYAESVADIDCAALKATGFELVLLGQGELDCVEYIKAMKDAGWTDFITVEVSTMVWSKEGYDPVSAASLSYDVISKAFDAAGVSRQ